MNCSCIDQHDGDAGPAFAVTTMRKARYRHRCGECRRDILPGEQYERVAGKWDNGFHTEKTCTDCLSVRNALFCSYYFGWIWEGVLDLVWDAEGEISEAAVAQVTTPARAKICDMIEARWADMEENDE